MKTYRLLDGTKIAPRKLSKHQLAFLATIERMSKDEVSYFEIYRYALGPGSPALEGGPKRNSAFDVPDTPAKALRAVDSTSRAFEWRESVR